MLFLDLDRPLQQRVTTTCEEGHLKLSLYLLLDLNLTLQQRVTVTREGEN